jgi:galactose mutarotase-like enzyme
MSARVEDARFQAEPGLTLRSSELAATFLPAVGMTGVSLRDRNSEYLAVPGGLAALRAGATGGLPLLAPWANRLSTRRYRAAGVDVDLAGLTIPTDDNGLPIHGLLVGKPGWLIHRYWTRADTASLYASIDIDAPAFPFPHRIELTVRIHGNQLDITTTLVPTARRRVPAAFGWHPYLRLPDAPRRNWTLRLPRRRHLDLDDHGIPTGREARQGPQAAPIGRRTFDDLYALERRRRLALESNGSSIQLHCGTGYDYAQVWVPSRRPFAALEPMVTSTNALVDGSAPLIPRGQEYAARFSLIVNAA